MNFKSKISENKKRKISYFPELCKSCGLCVEVCPQKAIKFSKEEIGHTGNPAIEFDVDKCIACKQCENICPDCAIKIERKQ